MSKKFKIAALFMLGFTAVSFLNAFGSTKEQETKKASPKNDYSDAAPLFNTMLGPKNDAPYQIESELLVPIRAEGKDEIVIGSDDPKAPLKHDENFEGFHYYIQSGFKAILSGAKGQAVGEKYSVDIQRDHEIDVVEFGLFQGKQLLTMGRYFSAQDDFFVQVPEHGQKDWKKHTTIVGHLRQEDPLLPAKIVAVNCEVSDLTKDYLDIRGCQETAVPNGANSLSMVTNESMATRFGNYVYDTKKNIVHLTPAQALASQKAALIRKDRFMEFRAKVRRAVGFQR